MLAVVIAVASAMLAGCDADSVEGRWRYASIEPLSSAVESTGLPAEDEAGLLAVFMEDAVVEFEDEGRFAMTFLGQEYEGEYEVQGASAVVTMPAGDSSSGAGTYRVEGGKLVFEATEGAGRLEGYRVVYERDSGSSPSSSSTTSQASSDGTE